MSMDKSLIGLTIFPCLAFDRLISVLSRAGLALALVLCWQVNNVAILAMLGD